MISSKFQQPPQPKQPKQPGFWSRLKDAIGTALGEAFVNR